MRGHDHPDEPADALGGLEQLEDALGWGTVTCTVCGTTLTNDRDDDPSHPTGPMCGLCYRARAFDDQLWATGATNEEGGLW